MPRARLCRLLSASCTTHRPSPLQRPRPLQLLLTVPLLQAELPAPPRCLRQTSRASAFKCRGAAFGLCSFDSDSASGAARKRTILGSPGDVFYLHPCHLELCDELPAFRVTCTKHRDHSSFRVCLASASSASTTERRGGGTGNSESGPGDSGSESESRRRVRRVPPPGRRRVGLKFRLRQACASGCSLPVELRVWIVPQSQFVGKFKFNILARLS